MDASMITKTFRNNEKKLNRLIAEAVAAGRPIPDKIPPTERAKRRERRRKVEAGRRVAAPMDVGPTPTPASTLRNRRRRARKKGLHFPATVTPHGKTQRRVNKALSERMVDKEFAKRGMK